MAYTVQGLIQVLQDARGYNPDEPILISLDDEVVGQIESVTIDDEGTLLLSSVGDYVEPEAPAPSDQGTGSPSTGPGPDAPSDAPNGPTTGEGDSTTPPAGN